MEVNKLGLMLIMFTIGSLFLGSEGKRAKMSKLKRQANLQNKIHSWAVIYEQEDKQGMHLSYRESAATWNNIPKALKKKAGRKVKPALLCVSGSWLIYDMVNFHMDGQSPVKFLSGDENCVDITSDPILSMQPITSHKFTPEGTISLFSKGNYSSPALTLSAEETRVVGIKQLDEPVTPLGSLVITGVGEWSLVSTTGKVLCVRPQPRSKDRSSMPVCYNSNLLHVQIEDFQVSAVYPDCPDERDPKIIANLRLTSCVEYESEGIIPLRRATDQEGRFLDENKVTLECQPNYNFTLNKFTPEESDLIKKLVNVRLTHDFDDPEQLLWPDHSEDIWKAQAIDLVFDIVLAASPASVINHFYIKIIREFTMFHLDQVWQGQRNGTEPKEPKTRLNKWKNHKTINHLLEKCLKLVEGNQNQYETLVATSYNQKRTLEEFESKIDPAFEQVTTNDPIIETAWVVANYAMAVCHKAFGYQVNFWDNFVTTFRHLYFIPLYARWRNPTKITPRVFRIILSGFGTVSQYKRLAFSASMMLKMTPNLHPFERYLEKYPL